jgi:broad specificity phosphatase PhoE
MSAGVELWLIRHGETEWSLNGKHTSTTDIPLTDHGRQRAVELKEFLAGKKFAEVLVSPMQRAKETCTIAGYGDVMTVEENLREWNYGEGEGKTTKEMREIRGADWSVWSSEIVGGETVEAVGDRADKVIKKAMAAATFHEGPSASGQAVALFAHAHILRILASRWIGLPAVDGKLFALGTGSVSVLGYERETRVISKWNRGFEKDE